LAMKKIKAAFAKWLYDYFKSLQIFEYLDC
jgi:hypothetical protein